MSNWRITALLTVIAALSALTLVYMKGPQL